MRRVRKCAATITASGRKIAACPRRCGPTRSERYLWTIRTATSTMPSATRKSPFPGVTRSYSSIWSRRRRPAGSLSRKPGCGPGAYTLTDTGKNGREEPPMTRDPTRSDDVADEEDRDHEARDPCVSRAAAPPQLCLRARRPETLKAHYALSLMGINIGSAYASGVVDRRITASIFRCARAASPISSTTPRAPPPPAAASPPAVRRPPPTPTRPRTTRDVRTVRMSLGEQRRARGGGEARALGRRSAHSGDGRQQEHIVDPVSALIMSVPPGAGAHRTVRLQPHHFRFRRRDAFRRGARLCRRADRAAPRVTPAPSPYARRATCRSPVIGRTASRPDTWRRTTTSTSGSRHLPDARVVVPIRIDLTDRRR